MPVYFTLVKSRYGEDRVVTDAFEQCTILSANTVPTGLWRSNIAICLDWRTQAKRPIYQGKRCDSDNGVEVMGLCSNPSWPADQGQCGMKV